MSAGGRVAWNGELPLSLGADQRYLIAVAAVVDGWCAVYDTDAAELIPLRCAG
jgi:hypothetical protein